MYIYHRILELEDTLEMILTSTQGRSIAFDSFIVQFNISISEIVILSSLKHTYTHTHTHTCSSTSFFYLVNITIQA